MEGLKEIGQEIGRLFVDAIKNQSREQSERDNMNYHRYQNMIAEELKRHREDVDLRMKVLEKRFFDLNVKGAVAAFESKEKLDDKFSFQGMKVNIDQHGKAWTNFVKADVKLSTQDCNESSEKNPGDKGTNSSVPISFKDDVGRVDIQVGSNSIKLTINGEQPGPKGRDSEAFLKNYGETKDLKEGSTSKSANHSVGKPKSTFGPCGKCRAMGHIWKQCPRRAKKSSQ